MKQWRLIVLGIAGFLVTFTLFLFGKSHAGRNWDEAVADLAENLRVGHELIAALQTNLGKQLAETSSLVAQLDEVRIPGDQSLPGLMLLTDERELQNIAQTEQNVIDLAKSQELRLTSLDQAQAVITRTHVAAASNAVSPEEALGMRQLLDANDQALAVSARLLTEIRTMNLNDSRGLQDERRRLDSLLGLTDPASTGASHEAREAVEHAILGNDLKREKRDSVDAAITRLARVILLESDASKAQREVLNAF